MPDDLTDEMLADRIKALLEERVAVASDSARVANIDRELRRFGHEAVPPAKRAVTRVKKEPTFDSAVVAEEKPEPSHGLTTEHFGGSRP